MNSKPQPGQGVRRKPVPFDSQLQNDTSFGRESSTKSSLTQSSLGSGSSGSPIVSGKLLTGAQSLHQKQPSVQIQDYSSPNKLTKSCPPAPQYAPPCPPVPRYAPPPPPVPIDAVPNYSRNGSLQSTATSSSPKTPRLTKSLSSQRPRSSSLHNVVQSFAPPSPSLGVRPVSPSPGPRGRSSSAQPPVNGSDHDHHRRAVSSTSTMPYSRPTSSNGSQSPGRDSERRGRLRRSWLPGGSRSGSKERRETPMSAAWILDQSNAEYTTSFLTNGEKVPELWNEAGTIVVYLHPKNSGLGPSFKVPSFVVDNSMMFLDLIEAEMTSSPNRPSTRNFIGRGSLSATDAELPQPQSSSPPPGLSMLYVPVASSGDGSSSSSSLDMERLISIRNLFAFLTGQPLVGTKSQPSLFSALVQVARLLAEFEFTNADGSTFGEAVEMSFSFFMDSMALADVRHSREKTLEGLVLGERMRSWDLYNEAFAHAVGKYAAVRDLKSPLWDQVSPQSRQKLERAHFELLNRQDSVNNRLETFDFPALFLGVANSTILWDKSVLSRINTWKKSFNRMRQFTLGHYKSKFGNWPPKARSKKNPFSESGLNRLVLKMLYSDLCALYDLIADRESLTPRVIDENAENIQVDREKPYVAALRMILGEYDRSSPPVLPPIPFDIPRLPDMKSIKENFDELPHKQQSKLERKLQDHELLLILTKSYDLDAYKLKLPFLEDFKQFELKEAKSKSVSDMADQRIGYWLFLYVVIQCLPMLVVDAPDLKYAEGVEYFLCQAPRGNPPWLADAPEDRRRWFKVSGGAGYVQLSEDVVEFSIEGIYNRSHCWMVAKQWEQNPDAPTVPPPLGEPFSPLEAPQAVFADLDPAPVSPQRSESPHSGVAPQLALRPRTSSPAGRPAYRSSIALGLEPVNMPPPRYPAEPRNSRIFSAGDSSSNLSVRPVSAMMRTRSRSSGDIYGANPELAPPPKPETHARQLSTSSTFDDILKGIENTPKKKKSGFFG